MMDKPAASQEDSRSESTASQPIPDPVPDTAQDPTSDATTRPSGSAWGTESSTVSSPAPTGSTSNEREATSGTGEREVPSWFARNREQRTPQSGETGLPDKETSTATDWFSPDDDQSAFVSDSTTDPDPADTNSDDPDAIRDSPAAAQHANDQQVARPIVMIHRVGNRGFLPRLAEAFGVSPTAIPASLLGTILAIGGVLALVALLANSAGLALTVLSAIVPILMLVSLVPFHGGPTSNATIMLGVTALNGVIVGGVVGWLAARLVAANWFDEGVLNFGAIGFGGHFAKDAGTASLWVWLVCGLLIPILALPASLIVPALAFRSGQFPDAAHGLRQGAAAGAGFAIGTATVFWAPLNVHDAPSFSTSDWTLMIIAVTFLVPAILVFATMLVASGLWQVLRTNQVFPAALAMTAGIAGFLVLRLGSLAIQPRQGHLWLEFVWTAAIAIATVGLARWIGKRFAFQD